MDNQSPPEIVVVSHYDLARVKEILANDPAQLNVMYEPWAETPLGAASHVGNRPIAEYLLSLGAPLVITTAAMLGLKKEVDAFLKANPASANATGAHGISLLYHAALSGSVDVVNLIISAGGSTDSAGHALHAATAMGHRDMVECLLSVTSDLNVADYQGKTPLAVAVEQGHEEIAGMLRAAGALESR